MRFRTLAAIASLFLTLAGVTTCLAQGAGPDTTGLVRVRPGPSPRSAWMIGTGGGYGFGGPRTPELIPDKEAGGTIHLRFGCGVSETNVVGVEYISWSASPTDSTSWEMLAAGPSLTWYWPSNFYARGMVGWGSVNALYPLPGAVPGDPLYELKDDGFALMIAGGWEWRYGRHLAVAPEAEFLRIALAHHTLGTVAAATIQLNWYF